MTYRSRRTLLGGAAALALSVATLALPATAEESSTFAPQLVTVDTPTRGPRQSCRSSGSTSPSTRDTTTSRSCCTPPPSATR
jgi:hypothetical protein